MNDEDMNDEDTEKIMERPGVVLQAKMDRWRAYTEQMRVDILMVRRLIARGEGTAAAQILGGMLDSTIMAGVSMDDAGANRPAGMPARPTGDALLAAEREANE